MKRIIALLAITSGAYALDVGGEIGTNGVGIIAQQKMFSDFSLKAELNYMNIDYDIYNLNSKSGELLITYDITSNFYIGAGVVYNDSIVSSSKTQHLCYTDLNMCADLTMNKTTSLDNLAPVFELGSKYYLDNRLYIEYNVGLIYINTKTHEHYTAKANIFNSDVYVWNNFDSQAKLLLPKMSISINYKF